VGLARAVRAVVASGAVMVAAGGLLGWLGLALDLVTLPVLLAIGLAAVARSRLDAILAHGAEAPVGIAGMYPSGVLADRKHAG
jgi:hypothetical protein